MREELIKSSLAYKSLLNDKKKNRLSHAYLLMCEDEIMRELFLINAAMVIMCLENGCGRCQVCKNIIKKSHVDVNYIDGTKARVKDANWLVEDAQTKSIEGDRKIYIIDRAEEMQASVQNKLLKTYEEPHSGVIMFLSASNASLLLPTIQSRAKKLYLSNLPSEVIIKDLTQKGINKSKAEIIAAYAQGSITRAERMIDNDAYYEDFYSAMDVLISLHNSRQVIDYIYLPIFNKDKIILTLDFLEIILSDAMFISTGANVPLKIINREYDLEQVRKRFSVAGLAIAILAINEGRMRLHHNVNVASVTEKILFDILEAGYKWR